MWREKAALWATWICGVVIVLACVLWAVAAQELVTPACDLPAPPPNAGPLTCPQE